LNALQKPIKARSWVQKEQPLYDSTWSYPLPHEVYRYQGVVEHKHMLAIRGKKHLHDD
jgi:hypothetical protein